jgi:hypothetical protein
MKEFDGLNGRSSMSAFDGNRQSTCGTKNADFELAQSGAMQSTISAPIARRYAASVS